MFMYIWLISLGLTLICSTSNVSSQICLIDRDCKSSQKCCLGDCVEKIIYCAECRKDIDCPFISQTCDSGSCKRSTITLAPLPTWNPPSTDECTWNSDCPLNHHCSHENRCERNYSTGSSSGSFWSGSRTIGIIFFVAVSAVLSCLYHMCKRARKPPNRAPVTQNAQTTSGPSVNEATQVEMHSGSAFSHNNTVIDFEENSYLPPPPPPPSLPADGPPPYSSLELQSQGNHVNEPELPPPPSYEEAVRNSSMPMV